MNTTFLQADTVTFTNGFWDSCFITMSLKFVITYLFIFFQYFFLPGLSYWKLDEKEMYHPLPENFRSEFADVFSTKASPEQVNFVS